MSKMIEQFYDETSPDIWKKVIGEDLHYHYGWGEGDIFFNAVVTLTSITKSSRFDTKIFKSMDKVCQMIYHQHKEIE